MSANLQNESGHSVAELVSGIVHDAQTLLSQQLALASGLLLVGVLLLCFMIVYILHELASLPLWGSFAIVGGVLTAAGIVLGFLGREQLRTVHAVPEKTAKALEENLEWKTKPT
jgi:hypothetical protein